MADDGPLGGMRVVELSMWIAGPGAGAILADWGAEVIKVESPKGDPFRKLMSQQGYADDIPNAPFTLDNRGKRSLVLDLAEPMGAEALDRLLGSADVFLTNLRMDALQRLGLDAEGVRARHPRLVYALITGHGLSGPDRDLPGYDAGAFGARAGVVSQMQVEGNPPQGLPLGFGDHVVALSIAGGIAAALLQRARTGEGQLVETSLLRTGAYALGWDVAAQLMLGKVPGAVARNKTPTPTFNCYQTSDGRWFWLLGVEADRHFPTVVKAIGREDLLDDEEFATARARRKNREAVIKLFDDAFAEHPLEHWRGRFEAADVWWAAVQSPAELVEDAQALAAGTFPEVGTTGIHTVATPITFPDRGTVTLQPPPRLGADTRELLREIGYADDEILALSGGNSPT